MAPTTLTPADGKVYQETAAVARAMPETNEAKPPIGGKGG